MRCTLTLILLLIGLAGTSNAQIRTDDGRRPIRDWVDPDLGGGVAEGLATEDVMWLRGYSRNVVRFDRKSGDRTTVATGVVDLLPDGKHLWVLAALNENESEVRDLRDPMMPKRPVHFEGNPLALFMTPDGPGVLTSEKVLLPTSDRWSRRRLAGSLGVPSGVSPLTRDTLLVGYNHGEWGGGLRRIDVGTGALSIVKQTGEPCTAALDPECAPIVGIIADPENAACALIGTSLSHLSIRRGEVFRICDDDITMAFRDPLPVEPLSIVNRPGQSWPFDSLIPATDGWVAVSQNRFARSRMGTVKIADVPALHAWSGLQISEENDGFIFIEAACCWGSDAFVQYRVLAVPIVD